jgi:hypothetical protein
MQGEKFDEGAAQSPWSPPKPPHGDNAGACCALLMVADVVDLIG